MLEDVVDGRLTVEAARNRYGVAIEAIDAQALDYRIDEEETARLWIALRQRGFEEDRGPHQLHPLTTDIKRDWGPTASA